MRCKWNSLVKYIRDTLRTCKVRALSSIAKSICKSKFLSSVVFFLAHSLHILIVLDIRKAGLVI